MTNPYMNSRTKITEKKTLGQIDEVEKLVKNDVRKMNITDNISTRHNSANSIPTAIHHPRFAE